MDFKDALDVIVVQVKNMIEELLRIAPYDKCYTGVILEKEQLNERDAVRMRYKIQINGSIKFVNSSCDRAIGDYIKILVPCNSWDKAFFIAEADGSAVTRIITEAMKKNNYVPKCGELILYLEQDHSANVKFGDGVADVNTLPFFNGFATVSNNLNNDAVVSPDSESPTLADNQADNKEK